MNFCPKCGSLLKPKSEKGKRIFSCNCGYTSKDVEEASFTELLDKEEVPLEVVSEKETLPVVDILCPKCEHTKAYFWMIQTRAGDEAETKFYKCEKCKHIWRDSN